MTQKTTKQKQKQTNEQTKKEKHGSTILQVYRNMSQLQLTDVVWVRSVLDL